MEIPKEKEGSLLGASLLCEPGQLTKIGKETLLARMPWKEPLGFPVKYLLASSEAHSIQYLCNGMDMYAFSLLLPQSSVT